MIKNINQPNSKKGTTLVSQVSTLISGSRRLAWSQSTETTGSAVEMDCVKKVAVDPTPVEAMSLRIVEVLIYAIRDEEAHE